MTHQRVSFGEHPCFGHDPEHGPRRRTRRLRYKRWVVYSGTGLLVITVGGMALSLHTSGMISRAALAAAVVSGIVIVGFLADPIVDSWSGRAKRTKLRLIK